MGWRNIPPNWFLEVNLRKKISHNNFGDNNNDVDYYYNILDVDNLRQRWLQIFLFESLMLVFRVSSCKKGSFVEEIRVEEFQWFWTTMESGA